VVVVAVEEKKPRQLDVADYLRIMQKRKWLIMLVTAVTLILGGLYAVSKPKVYRATALVLVRRQPSGFFWMTGEQANVVPVVAMETYARIARSLDVAKRTAKKLEALPAQERIIVSPADVRGALEVTVIEPDLLRIDARSPQEPKAIEFANNTALSFVEANTEMRRFESEAARIFLQEQVTQAKASMENALQALAGLSRDTGMVDVGVESGAAIGELREYENQRRQTWAELRQAKAEVQNLEEALGREEEVTVAEEPAPNPAWAEVRQQLTRARIALSELQSRYTAGHPEVQNAQAMVQELEEELANTPELLMVPEVKRSGLVSTLRLQLGQARVKGATIQARYDALQSIVGELRGRTHDLPEDRQQWQVLSDRAQFAREVYQNLLEELRQAKLSEAIKQGNAAVVDTAGTAQFLEASLPRALLFTLVLGIFCGIGLAVLLEALDDTIYTPDDLSRITDLRFLGVIPLRGDNGDDLVTIAAPKSPTAEAYRTLRSNIRFSLVDGPAKTFVICSAGAGEGKSLTAANLAIVCAQGGDSVILVDTDLRRPVLHRLFGREASPGLTNTLVGDAELDQVIHDTGVPGLRLVPTGPLPPNPAELLDSEQMDEVLRRLSSEADVIVLDSPPALILTDAGVLASKVDRTILVAESGQLTERAFADTIRIFEHARANVLGVVLNKMRVGAGDYYYYYYYYYYDYGDRETGAEGE
jgi:succinoglycan biosynthesis transport protein ExoP